MNNTIAGFFHAFQELCFPSSCLVCDCSLGFTTREFLFCQNCAEQIKLISAPLCNCCGKPFPQAAGGNHYCSVCLSFSQHFSQARAIFLFSDPIKHVIHRFKYNGKTTGLKTFHHLKKNLPHLDDMLLPDLIIPVPLHPKRLKDRGFNQALILARYLFPQQRNKIKPHLLERRRFTPPQTTLNGKARRNNLKNSFRVKNKELLAGKNILLVDDVFTTGTTVNECAKVMKQAGALEVQVLTLARVEE